MTVLLVYATFILLIIILSIIMIYFIKELIRRRYIDKTIEKEVQKVEEIFYRHMKEKNLKNIDEKQIKDLQKLVLTKKGLEAFNICYNNYISKHGNSIKLKEYVDMIIDYKVIHENHVVKERYKDSYTLYLLSLYKITSKEALNYAHQSLNHDSLYSRNNALRVIQNSSSEMEIIKALKSINDTEYYYNDKIIIDFITEFKGDKKKLTKALVKDMDLFNDTLKRIIIDYFTAVGDYNAEDKMLEILHSKPSLELILAAIKYFGKVISEDAYETIYYGLDDKHWEIRAICGKTIEKYDRREVVEKLKKKLMDSNWFVRFNCAISLINLSEGSLLEEILQIEDDFAKEIYIYALFSKGMINIEEYNELIDKLLQKELEKMLLERKKKREKDLFNDRKLRSEVGVA